MNNRNIEFVLAPLETHFVGDGFRVHTMIPATEELSIERMDPFLMLDYNSPHYFAPTQRPRGVGTHPHRGFETVTIAYQGKVSHKDNHGGGGTIGEGEVQWMTAGSGVLHEEFHEQERAQQGGFFQMIQLRLNLPAKDKMTPPKYQAITREKIAIHTLENGGLIEVIAGRYQDISGPATTFSPVHLMNAKLNAGGSAPFSFPQHYTTALLVVKGAIKVND